MFRNEKILKLSRLNWVKPRSVTYSRYFSTSSNPQVVLPLTGFKVVDLTRDLAGPYATQILADLGAEVIKVEHPTRGDDSRHWGPPFAKSLTDSESRGESAYFLAVNRYEATCDQQVSGLQNKKSLALDFKKKRGQNILKALIGTSDVVVENYLPGTLAKYGLAYEQLKDDKIIYASITGYGQTGPYKNRAGYDLMLEAEMGLMHITGEAKGAPVRAGVAITDVTTGLYAANSIMAAIISRSGTGLGQNIDIAMSDCQVATLTNVASSCLISGGPDSGRLGTSHASICPYQAFATKDGTIIVGAANDRLYGIFCQLLKRDDWIEDERFKTNALRVENRDILVPMITEETKKKTTMARTMSPLMFGEWLSLFEGSGIPYAAVNDIQATLNHPHVLARNMITVVEHPTCGPVKLVNTPIKFSKAKPSIREAPPTLGQHTDETLMRLGYNRKEIDILRLEQVVE
ncbi:caib/baif family protein-like protein [Lipomyces kononenkoae]